MRRPAWPVWIADTPDNRAVIAVCEHYRRALEARDLGALLALASPDYHDDAGTPADEDDDTDYQQLQLAMRHLLGALEAIRYDITYRRIQQRADLVLVDYDYSSSAN